MQAKTLPQTSMFSAYLMLGQQQQQLRVMAPLYARKLDRC
jgi:hypothetical protein